MSHITPLTIALTLLVLAGLVLMAADYAGEGFLLILGALVLGLFTGVARSAGPSRR